MNYKQMGGDMEIPQDFYSDFHYEQIGWKAVEMLLSGRKKPQQAFFAPIIESPIKNRKLL